MNTIMQAIAGYLESEDILFEQQDKSIIHFSIQLEGVIGSVSIYILCEDAGYLVCAIMNSHAKKYKTRVIQLLNRINYQLKYGNFEMDSEDGEIRYRLYNDTGDVEPSKKSIERSIFLPISMIDVYGESIIRTMLGGHITT